MQELDGVDYSTSLYGSCHYLHQHHHIWLVLSSIPRKRHRLQHFHIWLVFHSCYSKQMAWATVGNYYYSTCSFVHVHVDLEGTNIQKKRRDRVDIFNYKASVKLQ